ncbi:MAG TPA: tetratricopeptide repeat protein [Terriglobia bacterium]|nr:tetratricopeptide repeat protein [Terriglobia bacterium]
MVDSATGAAENLNMRAILISLLTCLLALASNPAGIRAQTSASESGEAEDTPHYVPPPPSESVEIGNFYFRRKDYSGALSRYMEAVTDDPDYAPAYQALGKVYEKLGKKREALAAYQKYLDELPSQKQADEARSVHKAMRRLERELKTETERAGTRQAKSSVPKH